MSTYHYVVQLTPEEYAIMCQLIVLNDTLDAELMVSMPLDLKRAFATAGVKSGVKSDK